MGKDLTPKTISVTYNGKKYAAKWSVIAMENFLNDYNSPDGASSTDAAFKLLSSASRVTRGMLMRAGLPEKAVDDLDEAEFYEQVAKIQGWFSTSLELMTKANTETVKKNDVAVVQKI